MSLFCKKMNIKLNNITTNFFPISFDKSTFHIRRIDYDKELLHELRRKYNQSYSFFRNGDYIYISPMLENDLDIGAFVDINLNEDKGVILSLLKHIFFRTFLKANPNYIPKSFYPFEIISNRPDDNLIINVLPDDLKKVLTYKKQIEIQFRDIISNNTTLYGLVVNIRYKWGFDVNCKILNDEGFGIKDLLVIHSQPLPGLENVLAPDESLVGILKDIREDVGVVETNNGEEKFKLETLFVHKTQKNISKYLEFKLGEDKAYNVFENIKSQNPERFSNKKLLTDFKNIISHLSKPEYKNLEDFQFSFSNNSEITHNKFDLINPFYIFDISGVKTNRIADYGLNSFGPFDTINFDTKNPNILVICHKKNRGSFSTFLNKLFDGIPNSPNVKYFKQGFIHKYRLHDKKIILKEVDDYSLNNYKDAISQVINENENVINLAIIEEPEYFKQFSVVENPYYSIKAHLLTLGIPVQFISDIKVKKSDSDLQYILNSISLQMYAKMGGTPWVIPANTGVDREIIVGIGSTIIRDNNYANTSQEKIVGITTFFSGDGKYLLGNKCREVSYSDYFEEMLASLRVSISSLAKMYAWQKGDTVRIIFHIFKPIKNIEAEVVDKLILEFKEYDIKYSFVNVVEKHSFILFDENQEGVGYYKKGEYLPQRSENLILNDLECLLQMKGPKETKTIYQGSSLPLLIKVHRNSTFQDLNYITQQIYNFSFLSWRSFLPSQLPVTILYSDLIANLLGRLKKIPGWNSDVVNTQLKFKKWFL